MDENEPRHLTPMIHVPDVRATVDWYESIGFRTGKIATDYTDFIEIRTSP